MSQLEIGNYTSKQCSHTLDVQVALWLLFDVTEAILWFFSFPPLVLKFLKGSNQQV
jgi:hypothetical protein